MAAVLCVSRSGVKPLAAVTLPLPHTIKPRGIIRLDEPRRKVLYSDHLWSLFLGADV